MSWESDGVFMFAAGEERTITYEFNAEDRGAQMATIRSGYEGGPFIATGQGIKRIQEEHPGFGWRYLVRVRGTSSGSLKLRGGKLA